MSARIADEDPHPAFGHPLPFRRERDEGGWGYQVMRSVEGGNTPAGV
jgi:hypothetical protein